MKTDSDFVNIVYRKENGFKTDATGMIKMANVIMREQEESRCRESGHLCEGQNGVEHRTGRGQGEQKKNGNKREG